MNRASARRIADALTWSRVFSVIPITILAWYGFRWWVLGLYIAAALTDIFDGMFARRATPSQSKGDLDGRADLLFAAMTLAWIWMLVPGFFQKYWLPYIPLLAVIQVYLTWSDLRWPRLREAHFQFGRMAMALYCFLLPVLIVFGDQPWFVHAVFIIGTLSKLQLAWFFVSADKPED